VQVSVRRKGLEDSTASFDWTVASPGPARARLVSNQPWGNTLEIVAGIFLVGIIMLAGSISLFLRSRIIKG
jgi:hypothetical protein